jgi:ABC-type sugar transport system permease subunit
MLNRQKRRLVLPFLAPAAFLYGVFFLWPTVQAFMSSVTDWKGVTLNKPFIGLGNFERLFSDPLVVQTLVTTATFVAVGGLILFPLALTLAYASSERVRGAGIFRFLILAPLSISVVAAAVLWKFVYDPNFGLLNGVLRAVGLDSITRPWLGQEGTALMAVSLVIVWQNIGLFVLFFGAAITNVPPEIKEAALVDGASPWQSFRRVTFPLIWEVTRVLLLYWVIIGLQMFVFVWAMTMGGPLNSTETIGIYAYLTAFQGRQWAYATAIAVALFVLTILITLVLNRATRRDPVQY